MLLKINTQKLVGLIFIIIYSPFVVISNGQNTIDWDGKYQLQLSDFQSSSTQIGNDSFYFLHSGSTMEFSFQMSSAEFVFTRNFNSKVNCAFNRSAASLLAPDSLLALAMVDFARYEFDLTELYARKFRKKMYEEKGAFSNVSFFRPIYDEIHQELSNRHTVAGQQTEIGRNKDKLNELHQAVLLEIEELANFCKTCKPPKKKK